MFLHSPRSRSPELPSTPKLFNSESHHKTLARYWVTLYAPRMMSPNRESKSPTSGVITKASTAIVISDKHLSPAKLNTQFSRDTVLIHQNHSSKGVYPYSPDKLTNVASHQQLRTPTQMVKDNSNPNMRLAIRNKIKALGNSLEFYQEKNFSIEHREKTPLSRGLDSRTETARESWENRIWKASTSKLRKGLWVTPKASSSNKKSPSNSLNRSGSKYALNRAPQAPTTLWGASTGGRDSTQLLKFTRLLTQTPRSPAHPAHTACDQNPGVPAAAGKDAQMQNGTSRAPKSELLGKICRWMHRHLHVLQPPGPEGPRTDTARQLQQPNRPAADFEAPQQRAANPPLDVAVLGQLVCRLGQSKPPQEDLKVSGAKPEVGLIESAIKPASSSLFPQLGPAISQRGSEKSLGKINPEVIASRNKFIRFLDENSKSRETSRELLLGTPDLNSARIPKISNVYNNLNGPSQNQAAGNQEDTQNFSVLTNGASQLAHENKLSKKLDFTNANHEKLLWDTPPSKPNPKGSGISDRLRTSAILDRLSLNNPSTNQNVVPIQQFSNSQRQPSLNLHKKSIELNPNPAVTYGFKEPRQLSLKNLSNNQLLVISQEAEKRDSSGSLAAAVPESPADPQRVAGLQMLRMFEMKEVALPEPEATRPSAVRTNLLDDAREDADDLDKKLFPKNLSLENKDYIENSIHSKVDSGRPEVGKISNLSSRSYKFPFKSDDIFQKPHSQKCPEPDSALLEDIDLTPYLKSSKALLVTSAKQPPKSEHFHMPDSPVSYCSSLRSQTTLGGQRPVLSEAKVQHPFYPQSLERSSKVSKFERYAGFATDSPFPTIDIGFIKSSGTPVKNFGQRASSQDFAI